MVYFGAGAGEGARISAELVCTFYSLHTCLTSDTAHGMKHCAFRDPILYSQGTAGMQPLSPVLLTRLGTSV